MPFFTFVMGQNKNYPKMCGNFASNSFFDFGDR